MGKRQPFHALKMARLCKRQPHEIVKHTRTIRRLTGDELFGCVWPFCVVGA